MTPQLLSMHAGDTTIQSRLGYLVDELFKVQSTSILSGRLGYLSAFPFEHFERLEALQPVWAPFYVVRTFHAWPAVRCRENGIFSCMLEAPYDLHPLRRSTSSWQGCWMRTSSWATRTLFIWQGWKPGFLRPT